MSTCLLPCTITFFFFSSKRRHTRLQGDWSSDVCSSDLSSIQRLLPSDLRWARTETLPSVVNLQAFPTRFSSTCRRRWRSARSEERRVGEERGSVGSLAGEIDKVKEE